MFFSLFSLRPKIKKNSYLELLQNQVVVKHLGFFDPIGLQTANIRGFCVLNGLDKAVQLLSEDDSNRFRGSWEGEEEIRRDKGTNE